MLVLSRRANESILIGDNILVTIKKIQGNRVKLSIDAPPSVRIVRGELEDQPRPEVHRSRHLPAMAEDRSCLHVESNRGGCLAMQF